MTIRSLVVLALLTVASSAVQVYGQVPVQDVASLTASERLQLVIQGVLAPRGLADYAPLHAYSPGYICDPNMRWPGPPSEVYAPAALITQEEPGAFSAMYFQTVREMFEIAQRLCNFDDGITWYIGTTVPVAGYEHERQFFSADAQSIAELLSQPRVNQFFDVSPDAAPVVETRTRNYERGETNDHCAGSRNVAWYREAEEGWQIVAVDISPVTVSSKSTYDGVEIDPDRGGFTVRGHIANNGSCVRLFGETVARDGRGTLRVAGTYQEQLREVQ